MDDWLYEIYNPNVADGCARLAAGRGEVRIRNLTFHKVTLAASVCNTVQYSAIYPALARPQLALWSSHPSNIRIGQLWLSVHLIPLQDWEVLLKCCEKFHI